MDNLENLTENVQKIMGNLDLIKENLKHVLEKEKNDKTYLKLVLTDKEYKQLRDKYVELIYKDVAFINRFKNILSIELLNKTHEKHSILIEKYRNLLDNSIKNN